MFEGTTSLTRDQAQLLAFFNFPPEPWEHVRTTNPVPLSFATVRLRSG